MSGDELHDIESKCHDAGGHFTYDPHEAKVFLGRVAQSKRAAFELRAVGLWTEPVDTIRADEPPTKRARINKSPSEGQTSSGSSSDAEPKAGFESVTETHNYLQRTSFSTGANIAQFHLPDLTNQIMVLKLEWLENSLQDQSLCSVVPYIVYTGRVTENPPRENALSLAVTQSAQASRIPCSLPKARPPSNLNDNLPDSSSMLSRAQADSFSTPRKGQPLAVQPRRRFGDKSAHPLTQKFAPKLVRTTTSEFEDTASHPLPEPPEWVKNNVIYSCLRLTPLHPVNASFLSQLYKIKEARLLTLDEIGVRAYSTSIAALAAYPYHLRSPAEILRLPGCDAKIAALFSEWHSSADDVSERSIAIVRELEADPNLQILRLFFGIWGVGAESARKLYFNRGYKELDDIIEFGWQDLTRVQQIGLKYYKEFEEKIERHEVEEIADLIRQHARRCRGMSSSSVDPGGDIEAIIVGGYRRGKEQCGDVDVILSHRDEKFTEHLIDDVIASLEEEGWITHTLTLHTAHSQRGQATLPFAAEGYSAGHGFDSLDKALVVWQDIHFKHPDTGCPTTTLEEEEKARRDESAVKNPNLHRRVDIIISPWRTVGCAVLGWSGATTFERDVRRWCKRERAWKFDSSGVRERATGRVIDLEQAREGDTEDTWQARERRVMEGLGIGWRRPEERCTG